MANKRLRQSLLSFDVASKKIKHSNDNFLDEYVVHNVPSDGDCLFSALALGLGFPHTAESVRRDVVNHAKNQEEFKDIPLQEIATVVTSGHSPCNSSNVQYLSQMSESGQWGDGVMVASASTFYQRSISVVLSQNNTRAVIPFTNSSCTNSTPICLGYMANINHYVFLEPKCAHICSPKPTTTPATSNQITAETSGEDQIAKSTTATATCTSAVNIDSDVTRSESASHSPESTSLACSQLYPKVCRNPEQFKAWQKSRPWLIMNAETGLVQCKTCAEIKRLGLHSERGQHHEPAFVYGNVVAKSAKVLLKKIDKHRDCAAHIKCAELIKEKASGCIENAMDNADLKFIERNKNNIDTTIKVFRTAYECAKSHLSFKEHSRLIDLQSLNGVHCGNVLYSHMSCSNIISHISDCMLKKVVDYIVKTKAKFSIMIDESTSVANVQSLILYVRLLFNGEVCTYFLGLIPLTIATAAAIESSLAEFFKNAKITDEVLKEQLIGFCSDGASCMVGQFSGVASLLKAKFPLVKSFHCMAHRLELAIKNAVDAVNNVSRFRCFVDELHKVYSMSPKNQSELAAIADALSIELMKVQKVFDVRWVFSSFVAVKAVLRDYAALYKHFYAKSDCNSSSTGKEKSKFKGLARKLQSFIFVGETCILKDGLVCLKQLSLFLQNKQASVLDAMDHVDNLKHKLLALKQTNGKTLDKFLCSYTRDGHYKCVEIVKGEADDQKLESFRLQFYQALHDNIGQRFPCTDLLAAARVLQQSHWPEDPLKRSLYGEAEVASLCKAFDIDSELSAKIVLNYAIYKQNKVVGKKLKILLNLLSVLPISSADCERGFSQMNLYHSSQRNRLLTETVSDLLMIGVNGPPTTHWNATPFVISWLKSGRHGALDKSTGLEKTIVVVPVSAKIFD